MSGTELIMGMEEIVQEMSELKEALAQKFYDHYDQMNYNKLNIARTVGPNLGRMVEHLIQENKRLQEENKSLQEENEELEDENEKLTKQIQVMTGEYEKEEMKLLEEEEETKELKEENKMMAFLLKRLRGELEKGFMGEIKKLKEEVESLEGTLEQAKEVAYHCGVELFCDDDESDED